jgi:hypothetical protein
MKGLKQFGRHTSGFDSIGTLAQTAEHLAIACTSLILKDSEEWTPTSHPVSAEYLQHLDDDLARMVGSHTAVLEEATL